MAQPRTHTVVAGDNLTRIAQRAGMTLNQVLELNPQFRANPNLIHPGQQVRLSAPATPQATAPSPAQVITPAPTPVIDSQAIRNAERDRLNAQLRADLEATQEAERLRRQQEIENLRTNLAGQMPAPQAPNLVDTQARLREQKGLVADETELIDIRARQFEIQTQLKQEQRALQARGGITQQFYEGALSEKGRAAQALLDDLNVRENLVNMRIANKTSAIQNIMNLTAQDYQFSREAYESNWNRNIQAQQIYNTQQSAERQEANAFLGTVSSLLKDNNRSFKDLDPAMINSVRQAEMRAGWIPGTLQAFQRTNPEAKILSTVNGFDAAGNGIVTFIYADAEGNPGMTRTIATGTRDAARDRRVVEQPPTGQQVHRILANLRIPLSVVNNTGQLTTRALDEIVRNDVDYDTALALWESIAAGFTLEEIRVELNNQGMKVNILDRFIEALQML